MPEAEGRDRAGEADPVMLGIEGYEDAVEIGRGGFGVVYRAYQPKFHRTVAIKVMTGASVDSKTRERFDRERLAMGSLSAHPGIMTVYDAGFTDHGHPFIVMEYTPEGSLGDLLGRRGPLTAAEVVGVGTKMAAALQAAHDNGILHRDVKPENIMVTPYGEPMLSDFGIARLRTGPVTTTGMVTATLDHAPPEILDGHKPSPQSDVYSLASSLYALLTGVAPFRQETDETVTPIIARIITAPVPPLPEDVLPNSLFRVLERAMAKEASDRYESATEFAQALQDAAAEVGLAAAGVALDAGSAPTDSFVKTPSEPTIVRQSADPGLGPDETQASPDPRRTLASAAGSSSAPVVAARTRPTLQDRARQPAVLAVAGFLLVALLGTGAYALFWAGGDGTDGATVLDATLNDSTDGTSTTTTLSEAEVADYDVAAGETLEIAADTGTITEIVTEPRHGVAVVTDGRLLYTADLDYSGNDSLMYRACGADDDCTLHEANFRIAGANPAPELTDDTASTEAPQPVTVDVLANDRDDDGIDVSSVIVISPPRGGVADVNPNGTITYTPNEDFAGTDKFQYEACDLAESPACDFATVAVTVTAATTSTSSTTSTTRASTVTTPPTTVAAPNAVNDALTVNEDSSGSVNVLANDTGQKDSATLRVVSQPVSGSASVSSGSITYTPSANYHGSDSFTYEICNTGGCDSATVTVTVTSVNDAPTASSGSWQVELGDSICLDLTTLLADIDGDTLTITAAGPSALGATITPGGTAAPCLDGRYIHYQSGSVTGTDTFSYTVSDGTTTASSSVTVTVNAPPNSAPTLECSASQYVNLTGVSNFWFGVPRTCFSDPDGDSLTLFSTQPGSGSVSGSNVNPDCDTSTLTCWRYDPPTGWDGVPFETSVQLYAVDPSDEQSPRMTVTLCVGCG